MEGNSPIHQRLYPGDIDSEVGHTGGADTDQVLTSHDTKARSIASQRLCSNASSNMSRLISEGNRLNWWKLVYETIVIAAVLDRDRVYVSFTRGHETLGHNSGVYVLSLCHEA